MTDKQSYAKFSGKTFREQLAAAAVSLTNGKCTFRACPFPAQEGAILCAQHRQFFSYESYLFDRSIEDHYRNLEDKFTADGLVIQHRRRSQQSQEDRILGLYHQVLGSAGMLADALKHLRGAPPSQIIDWSRNPFAAQELVEISRYPEKRVICPYCGGLDIARRPSSMVLFFKCRLCRRRWSLTALTILSNRHFPLEKWIHGLCILQDRHYKGVIAELQEKLEISIKAARRLNHTLRLCGETLGLEIGWVGQRGAFIREAVRKKLGLPMALEASVADPKFMTTTEVASHFQCSHGSVDRWITSGLLKATRYRQLKLVARDDIAAFTPPAGGGKLVPVAPTFALITKLLHKGFTKAELDAELHWQEYTFDGPWVKHIRSSTADRIQAVYDRLIQQHKTARVAPLTSVAKGKLLPVGPTFRLIKKLLKKGFTKTQLTAELRWGEYTLDHPRDKHIRSSTADRIKAAYDRLIQQPQTPRLIPSQSAKAMIQELRRMGFTWPQLARAMGLRPKSPITIRPTISPSRHERIKTLYHKLKKTKP